MAVAGEGKGLEKERLLILAPVQIWTPLRICLVIPRKSFLRNRSRELKCGSCGLFWYCSKVNCNSIFGCEASIATGLTISCRVARRPVGAIRAINRTAKMLRGIKGFFNQDWETFEDFLGFPI